MPARSKSGSSMVRRASSMAKAPSRKKASRGRVVIQFGLPRPAFSRVRVVPSSPFLAIFTRRFFTSKGDMAPRDSSKARSSLALMPASMAAGESVAAVPAPWEVEGVEVLMGRPFSRWPHCAARERRCPSRAVTCKESENLEGSFWRSRLNCAQPLVQPHAVGYFHRSEALSSRSRHKSRSCSNSSL